MGRGYIPVQVIEVRVRHARREVQGQAAEYMRRHATEIGLALVLETRKVSFDAKQVP